jgi:tRNA dimethylallyltransferase
MSQNGGRFNGQAQIIGGGVKISHISRERAVLIAGPTASGKSALAMEIATRDGRVIVNADALQVYDAWRILSARPSAAEEAALPHVLFGHIDRSAPYSSGHWLREVAGLLRNLEKPVVIVGGTGLNFAALTQGLADIPQTPPEIRTRANDILAQHGLDALLADIDAATRARIDTRNPARVQRAWEVRMATGRGLAAWQDTTGAALMPLNTCEALVLNMDTARLDGRIAQRFAAMMQGGALDEARAALPYWPAPHTAPAQMPPWCRAIGAPELVAHLRGQINLQTATESAILASRQYAKRQRTWFRSKMRDWQQFNL